jgi:uncharacterized protein (TIGR03086 family)
VVSLTSGFLLLESAVSYALASAGPATAELLPARTPCAGWDLRALLRHVGDSLDAMSGALRAGYIGAGPAAGNGGPEPDPVADLWRQAARLLATCAAGEPGDRLVAIADRDLTTGMVAVTGAMEIAVHGWDISVACGTHRPVPPGLAAALLPIAPLLVTPSTRPGLFAGPVPVSSLACPSDQLVAFLGRQPGLLAAPGTA